MAIAMPIIISAPSGAGKTSLVNALLAEMLNIALSISHTTRPMRPGESDGINYHFITEAKFQQLLQNNAFLEYAQVFDYYYGTTRAWVEEQLSHGIDVIFEIDWQGAQQLRKHFPEVLSIFILPPSLDILEMRLKERGQDNESVIKKRMQAAKDEISHYQEFDYLIVNDSFTKALAELKAVIISSRLKTQRQKKDQQELLENLMGSH